jgi:hypothetical protein
MVAGLRIDGGDSRLTAQSFTHAVAAFFKARPGQWINAVELEAVGGRQAWRTRVSECRKDLGMTIENKLERGVDYTVSLYRYLPTPPAQDTPHDLNGFSLR